MNTTVPTTTTPITTSITTPSTRDRILDHAQKLIRLRGCNGFSYRDLADHVGVKTSSIHYYFPSKDDLLFEAVLAYSTRTLAALRAIDAQLPADEKLDRYVDMSVELSNGEEICLCGMLAADLASVPERVAREIQGFVQANEAWLCWPKAGPTVPCMSTATLRLPAVRSLPACREAACCVACSRRTRACETSLGRCAFSRQRPDYIIRSIACAYFQPPDRCARLARGA